MIHFRRAALSFAVLICFTNCKKSVQVDAHSSSALEYAKGFSVKVNGLYKEVELKEPYPQATSSLKYLLVPKTEEIPPHDADVQVIRTPIERIVCTSTSHIALLDHLDGINKLVGFPTTEFISSVSARERIDSGYVTDLGIDKEMNLELLVSIQPDIVMGYSITGDVVKLNKIKELGIPVVVNGEYLEEHPLGRAEWIKYMALFLEKESMADSIFNTIKKEYIQYQTIANQFKVKPTVISGILYGDTWFLPGGQNYAAKIFRDAGFQYLWDDDPSNGFLQLSFEAVYAIGKDADFWIGVGSFNSIEEIKNVEQRYTLFRPFKDATIYTNDAKKGATGGSEYFELGYTRPDIILKDLIKIAHPESLPNHELFFHQKLK